MLVFILIQKKYIKNKYLPCQEFFPGHVALVIGSSTCLAINLTLNFYSCPPVKIAYKTIVYFPRYIQYSLFLGCASMITPNGIIYYCLACQKFWMNLSSSESDVGLE